MNVKNLFLIRVRTTEVNLVSDVLNRNLNFFPSCLAFKPHFSPLRNKMRILRDDYRLCTEQPFSVDALCVLLRMPARHIGPTTGDPPSMRRSAQRQERLRHLHEWVSRNRHPACCHTLFFFYLFGKGFQVTSDIYRRLLKMLICRGILSMGVHVASRGMNYLITFDFLPTFRV